jgi:sphingolipid 4-desaturase/C4-monooxygenase
MGKGGDNSIVAAAKTNSSSNDDYDDDFIWSHQDEPHASRRKAILQKHPEIKQLFGHDPMLKYKILVAWTIQMALAYLFRHQTNILGFLFHHSNNTTKNQQDDDDDTTTYPVWWFWAVAYGIGGTCNHMMFMAFHELSHNLGFHQPKHNRWYAMFANIPIAIPAAVSFRRYHLDHHKYQGVDGIDVDIPTRLEGQVFNNPVTKFCFVVFQLAFYAIRPMCVNPKPPGVAELTNALLILVTDVWIWLAWGPGALAYLWLSTFLGGGLHPVAGHFIAEHFVFPEDRAAGTETYSYYGLANLLTFNVGYHNEHHDFPFVPGSRLPMVREIAKEFYDPLPHHTSYMHVFYSYIFNPKITAFSRVKRQNTAEDDSGVDADPRKKQE